jgi:hypothetical protein
MARSINSPGVQITEIDLSTNTQPAVGTSIFVAGFSPQGPTDEVLNVTSVSELEQIYGTPTTPAERYFYYSCREILNSPATLLTTRLPYGSGLGAGFNNEQYSALLYPVLSSSNAFSIGKPVYTDLTEEEYLKIVQGNIAWSTLGSTTTGISIQTVLSSVTFNTTTSAGLLAQIQAIDPTPETYSIEYTSASTGTFTFQVTTSAVITTYGSSVPSFDGTNLNAGIVVLNKVQTASNEKFEGYYVAITDNSNIGPGTDFTSVDTVLGLTATNNFYQIPSTRFGFALSGTIDQAGQNSISEIVESIPTYNFNDPYYNDSVIVTVFKVRSSIYEPQTLAASLVESHIGSLDSTKKTLAGGTGGIQQTYFIQDIIDKNSVNIQLLVNPAISQRTDWSNVGTTTPKYSVRRTDSSLATFGIFSPTYITSNKQVGKVANKLSRALTLIESNETINVDVVVDAGLSTTGSNTEDEYIDSAYINIDNLKLENSDIQSKWRSITNTFVNFAQNTRKDCIFVSDPIRQIFVNGIDTKTLSVRTNSFAENIFKPLKASYGSINSSYAAAYGNWIKAYDIYLDRAAWLPASGYIAAVYARTDSNAQPWIAPAGFTRGTLPNVLDLGFNPNQKQRDFLYTASINPVVFFTGDGFVVFGQKTLQTKPSAFDRINVRRLFLTLEKAVLRTLKYFVFEPNTTETRTRLTNTIQPIFENAKNTEGLYDYLIVCDERNNPTGSIDNNELKVDIYLKPTRAAEFILVNFIATRTGQSFEELI